MDTKVDHVRGVGAGDGDILQTVAVQIADRETINRSLVITECDRREVLSGAVVNIRNGSYFDMAHYNVDGTITV